MTTDKKHHTSRPFPVSTTRTHLRILSAPRDRLPHFENVWFSLLEFYDHLTMVQEVLKMPMGLYSQFDVEESRIRGTLTARIYMSAVAEAVCQNLGGNPKLIPDGVSPDYSP